MSPVDPLTRPAAKALFQTSDFLLRTSEHPSRFLLELPIFRRPVGLEWRVEHLLQLRVSLVLAAVVKVQLGEKEVGRRAMRAVGERRAQVLFGELVAAADEARDTAVYK